MGEEVKLEKKTMIKNGRMNLNWIRLDYIDYETEKINRNRDSQMGCSGTEESKRVEWGDSAFRKNVEMNEYIK